MKRTIVLIAFISLLFTSCEKLDQNYNKIPADAPRLAELQQEYKEMLVANTDGWFMEYQPGSNNPSVPILMKFSADGKVSIISDRYGFDAENISTYRVGGVIGPELIFDTYSVYSSIAESGGGAFDFRMYPQENGEFVLKHATGGLEMEFVLRKARATDHDDIIARASVGRVLQEFSENSSAYFRNLVLDNISAFWELDINTQQVTLTWENSGGGTTATQTFSYTTLPGNGIRLAEPWTAPGGIEVEEIFFGDATPDGIEITSAGNAGAGEIQVAHIPAFPYPGTAKRYILSNSFNPNQDPVRFFASVSGTRETSVDRISPALWPYYEKLWADDVWPTYIRLQVYNYNGAAFTNSIQLLGAINGTNTWLPYYYALDEMDGSHVMVRKRNEVPTDHPHYGATYTSGTALTMYNDHPEFADFMDRIYPPGIGVTIVPLSGQNVRVVSRANSLYWMDLTISTPANFWNN